MLLWWVLLLQVRFVVLDEADQMLDMGFQEDMEVILQQVRTGLWVLSECVVGPKAHRSMIWTKRLQQVRMQVPNIVLHTCARVLLVPSYCSIVFV